jgi:DNA-binding response OmpR family regulator
VNKVLLVDAEPLRLGVLDVSLQQAGYSVTTAADGVEALEKMEWEPPDLVVADTNLPKLDGFALVQALKTHPELAAVPVVLLASEPSEEEETRAIDLGAEDYVPRPVYARELAARIRLLLANRAQESADAQLSAPTARSRLSGSTRDLALADLLQDMEVARATGVVRLRRDPQDAQIFFRDGNIVDAQLGAMRGEEAVYRALLWEDATFDVKFKPVSNEDVIQCTTHALVTRGVQRVHEWLRLCAHAQPLAAILDMSPPRLLARLGALDGVPEGLKAMTLGPAPRDSDPDGVSQIAGTDLRMRVMLPRDVISRARGAEGAEPPRAMEEAMRRPTPERRTAMALPAAPDDSGSEPAHAAPVAGPNLQTTMIMGSATDFWKTMRIGTPPNMNRPAPDAEAVEPVAALERRSSPSSAPWTLEADPETVPTQDAEIRAAGVPRALGKATKRLGAAIVMVAGVLGIVLSLHALRNRQMREAEKARGPSAAAIPAVTFVASPSTTAVVLSAPQDSPKEAPGPANVLAEPSASVAGGAVETLAAPPAARPPKDEAPPTSPAAIASPRAVRETALNTQLALHSSSSLVRDAQRSLLKGDTAGATELAQKAVSSDPSDADAWLTLAAARKAAGDNAGATEAYSACIAQAQTAGVTHCRVFALGFVAAE